MSDNKKETSDNQRAENAHVEGRDYVGEVNDELQRPVDPEAVADTREARDNPDQREYFGPKMFPEDEISPEKNDVE